jgi:hypothetical protein
MSPRFRGFLTASAAGLLLTVCVLPGTAAGQSEGAGQSDDSVADAARRAREQKKNAKPVRMLTNDDLPAAPVPAAEGQAATAPGEQMADQAGKDQSKAGAKAEKAAADTNEAGKEKRAEKKARIEATLKQAKADLAQSDGELHVLQRKEALDSDSYYSKTDYREDTAGKATLDQDAQDISDKKNQVETIKSKIADLTAELAELSDGEPAESQTEEQPQPQQQPPPSSPN